MRRGKLTYRLQSDCILPLPAYAGKSVCSVSLKSRKEMLTDTNVPVSFNTFRTYNVRSGRNDDPVPG